MAGYGVLRSPRRPVWGNDERQLVADRVSRALRQEADVRRNHEFFNGRNVARTPLSTAGQKRPVDMRYDFRVNKHLGYQSWP